MRNRTKIPPVIGISLAVVLLAGCRETNLADLELDSADQVATYKVIDGMWGWTWARAIEDGLKQLPGVVDAKVSVSQRTARVSFQAGSELEDLEKTKIRRWRLQLKSSQPVESSSAPPDGQ